MQATSDVQSERKIPIDIHYNKLLDWLIDRRHCQIGWQLQAKTIHEKIKAAVKDMPSLDELKKVPNVEYITYFYCLDVVELLKVSESDTKNFLGQYSSQRMKDWQEVVRLFERDSLYLPDCSSLLMRYVNYEVPAIKRQIAKCQQTQRECSKKEAEHTASSANFRSKFHAMCRDLKILGNDVHSEIKSLVRELPSFYMTVCEGVQQLESSVEYYIAFVGFVAESADKDCVLPMIHFLQQHGNATVYQYRSGTIPDKVIVDVAEEVADDTSAAVVGELHGSVEVPGEGQLSTATDVRETAQGTIDDTTSNGIDFGEIRDGIIDWGFGGESDVQKLEITVESMGHEEGVIVSGEEAETVLSCTQTRNELVDELLELESFFTQRLVEMKAESDIVSVNQFQSAPALLQMQSPASLTEMQSHVTQLLTELTSQRMHHLFKIKTSPRYVERLADSLQQRLRLADKMDRAALTTQERRAAALNQQRELEPQLENLIQRTQELQQQVSQSISKRYDDRMVNIMGEINTL